VDPVREGVKRVQRISFQREHDVSQEVVGMFVAIEVSLQLRQIGSDVSLTVELQRKVRERWFVVGGLSLRLLRPAMSLVIPTTLRRLVVIPISRRCSEAVVSARLRVGWGSVVVPTCFLSHVLRSLVRRSVEGNSLTVPVPVVLRVPGILRRSAWLTHGRLVLVSRRLLRRTPIVTVVVIVDDGPVHWIVRPVVHWVADLDDDSRNNLCDRLT
jgi:hypothetical protein